MTSTTTDVSGIQHYTSTLSTTEAPTLQLDNSSFGTTDLLSAVTASSVQHYLNTSLSADLPSAPQQRYSSWYLTASLLIGVLTVFGNSTVITVFCRNANLRKCRNYYILSLAIADLLVGLITTPVGILINSDSVDHDQFACLTLLAFGFFACFGSITSLVAVSIDRLSATHNPVTYHRRRNNLKLTLSTIAGWWVLSFLEAFLILVFRDDHFYARHRRCYTTQVMNRSYLTFLFLTMSIIPAVLLTCVYTYIYFGIVRRKMAPKTRASAAAATSVIVNPKVVVTLGARNQVLVESRTVREAKNAAKLASLVLVYALCWTPVNVMNIWNSVQSCAVPLEARQAAVLLTHCNSMLNPLLYAYYLREFRYPMQKLVMAPYNAVRDHLWPHEAQQRSEETEERPSRIRNDSTSFY